MRKISALFISMFLLALVCGELEAQVHGGLHFQVGIPMNDFRDNTDATGIGGSLNALFPVGGKESPIFLGFDLGYQVYGFNSKRETLTANITVGNTLIDQLVIPLRINTTNSLFNTHMVLRVKAPLEKVQPYFEGLIGFRYIWTRTRIQDDSHDFRFSREDDRTIVSRTHLDDFVFSYGAGGGVMFRLSEHLFLDLRCVMLKGSKASFYDGQDTENWQVEFTSGNTFDPGNVSGNDLDFSAVPRNSTTDMIMASLGLTVSF